MDFLESYDKNLVATGALVRSYDITRKRRINSDNEISFLVPMNSRDYLEKILIKGHVKDERGQFYVINSRSRVREDRKLTASVMCTHVIFKLTDFKFPYSSYIAEAYGVHISQLTNLISAASGGRFTFSIDDTFDLSDVKDFGQGNCLQALNKVIELYGCEIEADNFVIHLKKQIGKDEGMQYRIQKNIVSDQFKDDASSLVTRLFCQMKDGRTWIGQPASILTNEERTLLGAVPGAIVNGILQVNYLISPYAASWGSNSVPYFDGEIIEQDIESVADLLEAARKTLREKEIPSFEVTADSADLYKIRRNAVKPDLGDTAYCYDPDIELVNLKARIMELTEYPYTKEKHAQAVLSNVEVKDMDDIIADLDKSKKLVDNLYSNGRIRTELFEAVAKQVIADINNSKTELIYPEDGGILARDKNNHLRQVRLTSAGIGISTDGWNTIRGAITADGVLGERIIGQIGNFESLTIGSGNSITQINHNGLSAGHSNFNEAPFRVDMAGNVVANKLTANSAVINNSTFGGGAIIGSSINVGSGKFTVSSSGDLYTQGGIFSGGTITGALIRTAASGQRVEMDYSSFRSVDGNGRIRVSISPSGKYGVAGTEYFDESGSYKGGVYGIGDGFYIDVPSYMNLYAPIIAMNGNVRFYNASVEGIAMSGIVGLSDQISNLQFNINSKVPIGTTTTSAGPYNCGIPIGTQLSIVGGGYVTWAGVPAHVHTV
ncbi:phage tail protein [Paenibacillus sp. FSL R10-2199]|uniref:phage tail protein n=1 Tax=Paenibacillus sp. FSL R10-2199 TaxID=2975348 RepID=UPI0030F9F9F7